MTTEHATNSFHRSDLTTLLPPLHSLTSFSSHDIDSISPSTPVTTSSSLSPSSSLAPPSSHVTETSINDFYVILPDHDFHEKTGGIIKRGILRSESLKGKFHRKLGSVDILKYSDAVQEHWIRKLYPSPREHMIYRKHPYDQNLRYIGVDIFHSTILDEMQ